MRRAMGWGGARGKLSPEMPGGMESTTRSIRILKARMVTSAFFDEWVLMSAITTGRRSQPIKRSGWRQAAWGT